MAEALIRYRLDLILRLTDTTTGLPVLEKQVVFQERIPAGKNGKAQPDQESWRVLAFLGREEGAYILLNHGREDAVLKVTARGYETAEVKVRYETLHSRYPAITVPLIPIPKAAGCVEVLSLKGRLSGIEEIAAVKLCGERARLLDIQEKRGVLRLMEGKSLEEEAYGLIHSEEPECYEELKVVRRLEKKSYKIAQPYPSKWAANERVARIIRGLVQPDGSYLLRVRTEGDAAEYLIRYVVNGSIRFKRMDFYSQEERKLD